MTDLPSVEHDPGRQRFHVEVEGHQAELVYRVQDGRLVIDHTGVPAAVGGRGIAGHLVRAAFEHAREQGWRVVPACAYARAWVARHPAYAGFVAG